MPATETATAGRSRASDSRGLAATPTEARARPRVDRGRLKRAFDVLVASALLVVSAPIGLVVALLVKATSRGPIIYRQQRIGLGGRPFTILKFRSMKVDAERHTGPVWAEESDSRHTLVGRWLRRVRLDELPQLWNVLRGDMSLVGPRPERTEFVRHFSAAIPGYARRHTVRPGITGLAQIGRGYDASVEDVRRKLVLDLRYVDNRSLSLDLEILLRTVAHVARAGGR